jgi:hypothetical protein
MAPSTRSREQEEQRLRRQQRNRKRALLFGVIYALLIFLVVLLQHVPAGFRDSATAEWLTGVALLGIPIVYFATRAWRWPRMRARLATEVLSRDHRAPILYLRPFAADRRATRYERRIARSLKGLGPIVAVGRPEEELPATPHIAREYVADDRWQDRVVDLIGRAQLVVIQVGTSKGLMWELTQVVRLVRPDQLLACLGPKRVPWRARRPDADVRYRQFREKFGPLFPKGLPAELPGSAFIAFGSDWTPIPSRELKGSAGNHLSRVLWGLHRRLT